MAIAGKTFVSSNARSTRVLYEESLKVGMDRGSLGRWYDKDVCYADGASSTVIKLVELPGGIGRIAKLKHTGVRTRARDCISGNDGVARVYHTLSTCTIIFA